MRVVRIALALFFLSGLPVFAQTPVLQNEHFELLFPPGAQITDRYENSWETRMTVEHEGIRVRVNWKDDELLFHFPTSQLRARVVSEGNSNTINVNYNAGKIVIKKSPREIGWLLSDQQQLFFQTRGGQVAKVIGPSDYLKLGRQTPWGRISVVSSAGTTDALLNSQGTLEVFDGPELSEHLYLVKGLEIKAGPITLRLPLPSDPFLEGLPADRYFSIQQEVEALPEPAARQTEEKAPDPLRADPATWGSPELRAKFNAPDEDPLSVKKEKRVRHEVDPLRARTAPDSEEILRVKDY
ncbi:MAG: hypothetical protein WC314_05495 [Vulcanimicrobiota bacterium]